MMYRLVVITIGLIVGTSAPSFGQLTELPGGRSVRGNRPPQPFSDFTRDPGQRPALETVVKQLQLSEGQITTLKNLITARERELQPIKGELQLKSASLRDARARGNAGDISLAMAELRTTRDKVGAVNEKCRAGFR